MCESIEGPLEQRVLFVMRQWRAMPLLLEEAEDGWERLTKYFKGGVSIDSKVSAGGRKGESSVSAPWLGVQNEGASIPTRRPKQAKALRFTVGGKGTLVRGSLDSVAPVRGDTVIFTQEAKAFTIPPGKWDEAAVKELREKAPKIVRQAYGG